MKPIKPLYALIIAVVVAAAAFFGGMQYQKSQRPTAFARFGDGRFGQNRQFSGRNGQNVVTGNIVSADDNSVTVKLSDGSSKIVILSSNTAISKQASGSKSDLKSGERVAVIGTPNSDGSVTAQSISLNPQFRGMGTGSPTPTP